MIKKIYMGNTLIEYSVRKTKRKTSVIIVSPCGVEIKTPVTKDDAEIEKMILSKKDWIVQKQAEYNNQYGTQLKITTRNVEYLKARTEKLAIRMGMRPSKVALKSMKTRWGSTSTSGIVTLNTAIINAPLTIIDYVIIHELCHLKIHDHSKKFWNMLYTYDRDFMNKKKWLEINGGSLLKLNK